MTLNSLSRTALGRTPQGKRNRERLKKTWHRTVERELKNRGLNFETAPRVAADRTW
jgi:hypothetical protein